MLYATSGQRTAVVIVARDVPVGAQITKEDLGEASIAFDPAVKSVKAAKADTLVSQRAAVDLQAGSLLSPTQVTDKSLVSAGEQLVGVSVKPSQLPATTLAPGQKVLIVSTPDPDAASAGGKATNEAAPRPFRPRWSRSGSRLPATASWFVDAAVPAADGPALTSRVATGNVALIVASRDGS
ncbi:SAF domain-containing protein [Streptomyces sp. NPDC023998]|uniref:SAF domain-containing protein n=1 Tax=Streptomyces sp. NPDC023998 TaxID=3154597 RepID=UPI00340A1F0B